MVRFVARILVPLSLALLAVVALHAQPPQPATAQTSASRPPNPNAWVMPDTAKTEQSPIQPTPAVLKTGAALYQKHCQRCHGPQGKGDGPDADATDKPDDLSDLSRVTRNPDGVMFYKVWNGRKKPQMPGFSAKLNKDEAWSVVLFAKTLRKPAVSH
jgi:mono/diheme cytochrome c family protein